MEIFIMIEFYRVLEYGYLMEKIFEVWCCLLNNCGLFCGYVDIEK